MCKNSQTMQGEARLRARLAAKRGVPADSIKLRYAEVRKLVKLSAGKIPEFDFNEDQYALDAPIPSGGFFATGQKVELLKIDVALTPQVGTSQPLLGQTSATRFQYADPAYHNGAAGEYAALNNFLNSEGDLKIANSTDSGKVYLNQLICHPHTPFVPAANSDTGANIMPLYDCMPGECTPLKTMLKLDPNTDHILTFPSLDASGSAAGIEGTDNTVVPGTCNYALFTYCGCIEVSGAACDI